MGSDELQTAVRNSIAARGVKRTADLLELSAEATCKLAGGLRTQRGTRAQAAANLHRLAAQNEGGPRAA